MKLSLGGDWRATVTDDPLHITPRFDGGSVRVMRYADVQEREGFFVDTFGSRQWLWDAPDVLRFDPAGRQLVGAEFQLPEGSASAEDAARLPSRPRCARAGCARTRSGTSGMRCARCCVAFPGTPC